MKALMYFMFFILVVVLMTNCNLSDCACDPPPPTEELILQVNNASEVIPDAINDLTGEELRDSGLKNYFFWGKDDEGAQQRIPTSAYYRDYDGANEFVISSFIYDSIANKGLTTLYFTIGGDIDTLQLDVKATRGRGYPIYTINQIKINDYIPEKLEVDFNYQGVYIIKK